jgi:hypothetical protein
MKSPRITPDPDRLTEDEITLTLSHKVPDMERGFTICTTYGDIGIPPGRIADKLMRAVALALQCELLAAAQRAAHARRAQPL